MSISYNLNIPDAPNNPSDDQPLMQINTNALDTIIAIDHISFNTANGGNHQQVHLPSFTNPSVVNGTATQGSVIYSAAGTADTARAQIFYKNAFGVALPISPIKAFGSFDGAGVTLNSINVTAVRNSQGNFTLTITANAITGTNYSVLACCTSLQNLTPQYTIVSATQVTLIFRNVANAPVDPTQFSVAILQI